MPIVQEQDYLEHYGMPRRSGRYPWGSGENPYQRLRNPFYTEKLAEIKKLHDQKFTDDEIVKAMGLKSTTELRRIRTIAREEERNYNRAMSKALYDYGWTKVAIAQELDISEANVRAYLKATDDDNAQKVGHIADVLRDEVANKKFVDIGAGSEQYVGISRTKFDAAVQALQAEGYSVHNVTVEQLGTGQNTTIKVLAPPGTQWKDVMKNRGDIQLLGEHVFVDNGKSDLNVKRPIALDPKRVQVRYAEDGGIDMDGVIQIRRGVEDLDLGGARYAQVRIKVGDGHYLKGMAMYADDLPDGVDIMFNTNKRRGTPMLGEKDNTVLKPIKDDPDNQFGANIQYQPTYIGKDGKEHQSALNIVNKEGDWSRWSKNLASQFLSKQSEELISEQLGKARKQRETEYEEIMALTNPTLKKKLLEEFADTCDGAAVHLKAAGMPGQASKVILPIPELKSTEIYAPDLDDGTRVVLVRYPHAGKFECPELIVNNKNAAAKRVMFNARDAVGINAKVAEQLSGADFDGDTVLVIPNNERKISTSKPLAQLADFDPKIRYAAYEGMPRVGKEDGFNKPREMGSVSNLITDMTLKGAGDDEIAMAVRHSMVVIDAEKHNLDWKQSAVDNNIAYLKAKWQGSARGGASTLISKASARADVPMTKKTYGINKRNTNPETGERIDQPETGETWVNKKGQVKLRTRRTTKMAATKDAYSLLSDNPNPKEVLYADYANAMKALANQARKSYLETPSLKYDPQAKIKYAPQVESINKKLKIAQSNAPLERQAQIYANQVAAAKIRENAVDDYDTKKKIRGQALKAARDRFGASKSRIEFTDDEWEAVQAGAISDSKLREILNNANTDKLKQRAMPRTEAGLTSSQANRALSMYNSGRYSVAQIAKQLGVSTSTIYKELSVGEDETYD